MKTILLAIFLTLASLAIAQQSATSQVTITITAGPLIVVSPWNISAAQNVPMSASMNISGVVGPYTCTLTSGALPAGLSLTTNQATTGSNPTSATCQISGTASGAIGSYAAGITVTSTQ